MYIHARASAMRPEMFLGAFQCGAERDHRDVGGQREPGRQAREPLHHPARPSTTTGHAGNRTAGNREQSTPDDVSEQEGDVTGNGPIERGEVAYFGRAELGEG